MFVSASLTYCIQVSRFTIMVALRHHLKPNSIATVSISMESEYRL